MKVLITGAAGFIGSHLAALLAAEGNEVHCIDNLSPYYAPDLKKTRFTHIVGDMVSKLTNLDLVEMSSLRQYLEKNKFDSIVHLAAQPGVRTPLHKSNEYIQNNVVAFTNILQLATELEVPSFLYASSSSVYGNSKQIPYSEASEDIRPVSIYGATKRTNELLTPAYVRGSKTRARGLRFFTVYGPWGRPDMAYFRLINASINRKEFVRFGDGDVKRDFTYISDITNQISALQRELMSHEEGFSDIVNIGGGNPQSLNDLIKSVGLSLGMEIQVSSTEMNPNDTFYTCADVSRQNSLTGFVPRISLEIGIQETIKWATDKQVSSQLDHWVQSTS